MRILIFIAVMLVTVLPYWLVRPHDFTELMVVTFVASFSSSFVAGLVKGRPLDEAEPKP
jgi:hypothetical protein